jgi:hypothetical protein
VGEGERHIRVLIGYFRLYSLVAVCQRIKPKIELKTRF